MSGTPAPTIAVDIDEVLSPLRELFFAHHNQVYGTNYPIHDPGGGYFLSDYSDESNDEIVEKIRTFIETDTFKNVQPLTDAIKVLRKLRERFEIVVITARQDFYYDFTHQWLEQYFPSIFRTVHFTEYIAHQDLKIPKSKLCLDEGASYMIDDNLTNAMDCAQAGLEVLLFGDYLWNQTDKVMPDNITRVAGWRDVLEYFNGR